MNKPLISTQTNTVVKLALVKALVKNMITRIKADSINYKNTIFLFLVFAIILSMDVLYLEQLKLFNNDLALELIKNKTDGAVVIDKEFPAIGNLEGFLVHFKQEPTNDAIIYVDKQGRYMVMGDIIDQQGVNITTQHTAQYIHNPIMINAFNHLYQTHWILQGNSHAKRVITIMIDPNSPIFPLQYEHVVTDVAENDLAVRWILVSYLKPVGGDNIAAAILQAKNPIAALAYNANHYDFHEEMGGIAPVKTVTQYSKRILQDNWNFMQKYKFNQTPIVFYQTLDGKSHILVGFMMDEMLEHLIPSLKVVRRASLDI